MQKTILLLLVLFSLNAFAKMQRHYLAHSNYYGYLDGERQGSLGSRGINVDVDDEGNIYYLQANVYGNLRCIQTNGRVVTITGNEYYLPDYNLSEGPAVSLATLSRQRSYMYDQTGVSFVVLGVPGKGEGHGVIYAATPKGELVKIWKRADNGRWWFKRVAGGGANAGPATKGDTISGKALKKVLAVRYGPQGSIMVFANAGFFRLDTATNLLTCVCGRNDWYQKGTVIAGFPDAGNLDSPGEAYMDTAGTMYFNWYQCVGGAIVSVTPPHDSIKLIFKNPSGGLMDGPLPGAAMFCAPQIRNLRNNAKFQSPGVLYPGSQDDGLHRILNDRLSSMNLDGEWRENRKMVNWVYLDFSPGPNNTAFTGYSYTGLSYDIRLYQITGFDGAKPTVP